MNRGTRPNPPTTPPQRVAAPTPARLLASLLVAGALLLLLLFPAGCFSGDAEEAAIPAGPNGPDRQPARSVTPACEDSLQAKIDRASAGGTVRLADDCVYRESVTVDKPLELVGPGEIRGSDVWGGWTRSGPYWVSTESVPEFPMLSRFRCEEGNERCLWPEQVFVDGEPLEQVASGPRPGQFALDGARRVVLADDPAGRRVEVTVRPAWVVGESAGVTVRGVAMKHAAMDGLWNGGYPGWTVEESDLSWAHTSNLKLTLAGGLVARANELHHGGQLGLASNKAAIEVSGNRVYSNNTEGFDPGWEAGGMKISQPFAALVSENDVHANGDIGIWLDTVNEEQSSVEIARNRVHDQPWQGIRVEITKNFSVRENVVWENGWARGDSYNGAGISVDGSFDGTVTENVLAWNASGIGVVQQDRSRPEEVPYQTTRNVRLLHNRVIQDEVSGSTDHAAIFFNGDANAVAEGARSLYDPAMNNGGSENRFWFDEPEGATNRFKWTGQIKTLSGYNATPAESGGRYLSDGRKDALLREYDLPLKPRDH